MQHEVVTLFVAGHDNGDCAGVTWYLARSILRRASLAYRVGLVPMAGPSGTADLPNLALHLNRGGWRGSTPPAWVTNREAVAVTTKSAATGPRKLVVVSPMRDASPPCSAIPLSVSDPERF